MESLGNLRKLPTEAAEAYGSLQSWYYEDSKWTGTWSSREEGFIEDFDQSDVPLKLTITAFRGSVVGEMFNRSVCELSPLIPPVLVEGEIQGEQLLAHAYAYIGGKKQYLYDFTVTQSIQDPVITVSLKNGPRWLLPPSARLVLRMAEGEAIQEIRGKPRSEHPDLVCTEGPMEYLQRLRKEGKLKGLERKRN